MSHTHFPFRLSREPRLVYLDKQRRNDLVEEAAQTEGKMNRTPEQRMEAETESMVKSVGRMKVSWGEWFMSFGNTAKAMDKKLLERIQQQADLKIKSESDLAVGKIKGIFLRGKRKLYLATRARIEAQVRENLTSYLQMKQKESMEREGRFSRLAQLLRNNSEPIHLKSSQDREKLLGSLARVQAKLDGNLRSLEAKGATLPPEWESARQTEQMLKEQLLKLDIVSPSELETYLDSNARGDSALYQLIRNAPQLQNDAELRTSLQHAVYELRQGYNRYYRLQKFTEKDPNVGTVQERTKILQADTNSVGKTVRLSISGAPPVDTFVTHRAQGYLVLRIGNSKEYVIMDTQTSEITYKDPSNVYHDEPLKESSFFLLS